MAAYDTRDGKEMGPGHHHAPQPAPVQEVAPLRRVDQSVGFGL